MTQTMKPITLKVPPDLLEQADFIARALGFSRAELIRQALARDLRTYGKAVAEVQNLHKEHYHKYQDWLQAQQGQGAV